MDNTEFLTTNVYTPGQFLQWALFTPNRPLADRHRFTSPRRLQCSPFTLALRNNRYERQSTGGFGQYFQLCSPKYWFTHKSPWECRPQFSRCIISIILSHQLVRMANTHDHELRASAHPYRITDNCHLVSCPAQNPHQPQEGWLDRIQVRNRTQTELASSSNWLPEGREVVPSDTIEGCFPSYPYWKT